MKNYKVTSQRNVYAETNKWDKEKCIKQQIYKNLYKNIEKYLYIYKHKKIHVYRNAHRKIFI